MVEIKRNVIRRLKVTMKEHLTHFERPLGLTYDISMESTWKPTNTTLAELGWGVLSKYIIRRCLYASIRCASLSVLYNCRRTFPVRMFVYKRTFMWGCVREWFLVVVCRYAFENVLFSLCLCESEWDLSVSASASSWVSD